MISIEEGRIILPIGRSLGRVALPVAPSYNRFYRTFRGRNVISADGRAWLREAAVLMKENIEATDQPVVVVIQIRQGKGIMVTSDLDNLEKATMDALKPETRHKDTGQVTKPGAGVIKDDCMQFVQFKVGGILPEIRESKSKRGTAEQFVEVFLAN